MNEHKTETASKLRFLDYVVDYVEFKNNAAFDADEVDIDFNIHHKVVRNMPDTYVTLRMNIFPDAAANNYPFSFSISATGHFQIDGDDSEEANNFLNVNAVAILFPYLRALVTTYTANANVTPLILPPVNIAKMLEKNSE